MQRVKNFCGLLMVVLSCFMFSSFATAAVVRSHDVGVQAVAGWEQAQHEPLLLPASADRATRTCGVSTLFSLQKSDHYANIGILPTAYFAKVGASLSGYRSWANKTHS